MTTEYFYDLSQSQELFVELLKPLKWLLLVMESSPRTVENEELAIRVRIKAAMANYRASRGWTLREMATFLGVGAKSYEKYECDETRGVPVGVIARFCRFSGVDLDWIMYGKHARAAVG